MSRKSGNIVERYADKAILAVIGLVCIWLLITRVFISASAVEIDGRKLGPGRVDVYVNQQIGLVLEEKLNRSPEQQEPYDPRIDEYVSLLDSSLIGIKNNSFFPLPGEVWQATSAGGSYAIPTICDIEEVVVEYVRKVAIVQNEQQSRTRWDFQTRTNRKDIDLITVEGRFNAAELFARFTTSFDVSDFPDKQHYAVPVFAAVQLQRQQLQEDMSWSDWEIVPRIEIQSSKTLLDVPESVGDMEHDVELLMLRFDAADLKVALLQPGVYNWDESGYEWLPPSLERDREKRQIEQRREDERQKMLAQKQRAQERREEKRRPEPRRDTGEMLIPGGMGEYPGMPGGGMFPMGPEARRGPEGPGMMGPGMMEPGMMGPGGFYPGPVMPTQRESRKASSEEFKKISISDSTNFAMLTDLRFWAHDDTVHAGKTYRYKIRLGVFNPIAGSDMFKPEQLDFKDKVILWSKFSQMTDSVNIPEKNYFFPLDVKGSEQIVTIQVSRYLLGKWYSTDFDVRLGEEIGGIVESSVFERSNDLTVPEEIDYSTGVMLVDVLPEVSDWEGSGALRRRDYSEILYTVDGEKLKHIGVKRTYWPEELQEAYRRIEQTRKDTTEEPQRRPPPRKREPRQRIQRLPERRRGFEMGPMMPGR
ncbi:MAG: hypothetical protein ABIG61_01175 [Planctomycetota bacterium]